MISISKKQLKVPSSLNYFVQQFEDILQHLSIRV